MKLPEKHPKTMRDDGQQIWLRILVRRLRECILQVLAFLWRRLLFQTTFIAITGSLGKTTAKECLSTILSSRFPTAKTFLNQNDQYGVPRNILRVRPWHRFAVIEVGIGKPAHMRPLARIVRPDIVVMLNVLRTHTVAFRDLDEHAAEKARLLDKLRPRGWLVLNGDDPRVRAMADPKKFRIRQFGTLPPFDLWADEALSRWPERFTFQVHSHRETNAVKTNLVGTHWLTSVLAALATATCCGISLGKGVQALKRVEPFHGRLQPVLLPMGATVLRDDYNASIDGLEAGLRVLQEASAERRLLVISDFSDFGKNSRYRRRYLARHAARVAEVAVIIGEKSEYGRRRAIEAGLNPDNVHAFRFLKQAAEFLKTELKPKDLVLLKGRTTDHVARVFFAQLGEIKCWKEKCRRTILCDFCPELGAHPR